MADTEAGVEAGLESIGEHTRLVQACVSLDWRDPKHWSPRKRPCRVCRNLTHLRDDQGRPCDKPCAEKELAAEYVRQHNAYFADERTSPRSRPLGEVRPR